MKAKREELIRTLSLAAAGKLSKEALIGDDAEYKLWLCLDGETFQCGDEIRTKAEMRASGPGKQITLLLGDGPNVFVNSNSYCVPVL